MKISFALTFLFITLVYPQTVDSLILNDAKSLEGVYGLRFGMEQEEVVNIIRSNFGLSPAKEILRDQYIILEFNKVRKEHERIDKIRVFIHPEHGVFWVEEELYLQWNLQKTDSENLERHQKRLTQVLERLRREYGRELLLENEDLERRFSNEAYVTASWSFQNNRWIHMIFEPQDWSVWPERNKIIVIYRDSTNNPQTN